jgi:hypothetical protein
MATTQVAHPWRATARTAAAAAFGLFPLLNGILSVCMDWLTEYTPIIPGWLYLALNGILLAAIALTALVTRILAVPGVVEWTRKHLAFLSPDGNKPGRHEA